MSPTVVNRHHFHGDQVPPGKPMYIGRGTPLGNPFTVQDYGAEAIGLYRRWLFRKIMEKDAAVLRALASITEETALVCSCKPRPCHGDVVLSAWKWLRRKGAL